MQGEELFAMMLLCIAGVVVFLGWIFPLMVGLIWRSRNSPGFRTWLWFSALWGGVAIFVVLGIALIISLEFSGSRARSGQFVEGDGSEFSAASFKGPTGNLKIPFTGEVHIRAECKETGEKSFSASNSIFIVPAGTITIKTFEAVARDSKNRKWMARGRWLSSGDFATNSWEVPYAGVRELAIGPPFRASIRVSYSAVSDHLGLEPQYFDSLGNSYSVCSDDRTGTAPGFELVDSENKLVMSGKFEFG